MGLQRWRDSNQLQGIALRALRRLEVATSNNPIIQGDLSLCGALESAYFAPLCRVAYILSPPSLTRLSVPLEITQDGEPDWESALRASIPGLRELQLFCGWTEGAMMYFDNSTLDRDLGANTDGELLYLGQLSDLAPGLEILAVDCSGASGQSEEGNRLELGLTGAQWLPKGLRSLTVTQLGFFCYKAFLQGLSALQHLTQLCLPKCQLRAMPSALKGLTRLEDVQLNDCTSEVVGRTLAPLRALPRLRRLSLAGCDLRQVAAEELVQEGWPALQELDLALAKVPG